jgi:hypothetical protein
MLLFSAPMMAREDLTADEVSRFIAVADDLGALGTVQDLAAPTADPAVEHPGLSSYLLSLDDDDAVLARHGFTPETWHKVSTRVMSAHRALLVSVPREDEYSRKLSQDRSLSPEQRHTLRALMAEQRRDMAAVAADTQQDQAVVAPFRERLEQILIR